MLRAPRRCPSRDGDDVRECVCHQHNPGKGGHWRFANAAFSLFLSVSLFLSFSPTLSLPYRSICLSLSSFLSFFLRGTSRGDRGRAGNRDAHTWRGSFAARIFIAFIFLSRRRTVVYFPDASFCAASATVSPLVAIENSVPFRSRAGFCIPFSPGAVHLREGSVRANIPLSDLYRRRSDLSVRRKLRRAFIYRRIERIRFV